MHWIADFCVNVRIFSTASIKRNSNRDFALKFEEKFRGNLVVSGIIHFGTVMPQIMKRGKIVTFVHFFSQFWSR